MDQRFQDVGRGSARGKERIIMRVGNSDYSRAAGEPMIIVINIMM